MIAACLQLRTQTRVGGGGRITLAQIGELIGRDKSVVSREIARNSGPDGSYHGGLADHAARQRRCREKEFRLVAEPGLCRRIEAWMDQGWSPRLIARVLRGESPHMIMGRVSHETIYQALYVQTRGSLRKDLYRQLSTKRPRRRPQTGVKRANSPYKEAFKISQRPPEVADRAVPGHWEGDLVIGAHGRSAIVTLVERSTRYVMLGALPNGRVSDEVIAVLSTLIGRLPEQLRRSLTWDLGTEMAHHPTFTVATGCPVFFCDPHSPWQRGSNENTNGLLRQYFPKHTFDFHTTDQAGLDAVARELNGRPRMTLQWQTPAEELDKLLGATAA